MSAERECLCPLCGSGQLVQHIRAMVPSARRCAETYRCTSVGYGSHPAILRCRDCRFVFLEERPTSEELAGLYGAVEDPAYEQEEAGRQVTFDAHLERLEKVIGPPGGRRLLDVGAYTGVAVEVATRRGWRAVGVDPCRWAVESGRRRGRRLLLGTPDDENVAALGPFDVVTLWDVIEHLADPEAVLATVHDRLVPGGYVVIHTMDVNSLAARFAGHRWPWYMEMHLFYFSPDTLRLFLRKTGFEPVHIEHRGRTVSVGYLASRLAALVPLIGRPMERIVKNLELADRLVRVGFGDLFTMVARRASAAPAQGASMDSSVPSPALHPHSERG